MLPEDCPQTESPPTQSHTQHTKPHSAPFRIVTNGFPNKLDGLPYKRCSWWNQECGQY